MWRIIRLCLSLGLVAGLMIVFVLVTHANGAAGSPRSAAMDGGGSAAAGAMLVSLLLALLMMAAGLGWQMLRRRAASLSPEQALIEEVLGEEKKIPSSTVRDDTAAPWEKPADWWKNETS